MATRVRHIDKLKVLTSLEIPAGGVVGEKRSIVLSVGDGINEIVAGAECFLEAVSAFTVTGWTVLADVSGSIEFDVRADTYANFPPTGAESIVDGDPPLLSSAQKNQATGLSWSVAAGDILGFYIDSADTVTRVSVTFTIET